MGGISAMWKDMWVLPTMVYDIIISTDWMQKHNLHISFSNWHIKVNGQTCNMKNVRKDLIRECSVINAHEVKELMKKDKIVKLTVWSVTKIDKRNATEEEVDEHI
jgi:hypothetical protein